MSRNKIAQFLIRMREIASDKLEENAKIVKKKCYFNLKK